VRRLLFLLALAPVAAAAPSVRWIDKLGNVHREGVAEVAEESTRQVKLKLANGEFTTLPTFRLLSFVRERDRVAEERALLAARLDVGAGLRLDEARPVLDRLAASGREAWVREYAAAARAELAERAGEPDAKKRLDAFLKAHPESRFVSRIHLARARIESRTTLKEPPLVITPFEEAFHRIGQAGGPAVDRFHAYVEAARRMYEEFEDEVNNFLTYIGAELDRELEEETDAGVLLVSESCHVWAHLLVRKGQARVRAEKGQQPRIELREVRRLRDRSRLLLPELRCDLNLQVGILARACGREDEAKAALEQARKLAPDPLRRAAVEKALAAGDG